MAGTPPQLDALSLSVDIVRPVDTATTCYRHPDREAPLRCTRCDRPSCLDDAVDAPVGFLCPDDAQQSARVRRVTAAASGDVTKVLTGMLVAIYVLQQVGLGDLTNRGLTFGPLIAEGEWWRLVTGGFLHGGLLHIGFNAYLLYQLGMMLEPVLGRSRFLAVYAAGLAGGSAGVMLLSWDAPTLGASGAVFGLMGAAMIMLRRRGINPWQTSIGSLVLLNLVITFIIPAVSIGGHLGGLAGGALAAATLLAAEDRASGAPAWIVAGALMAAAYGAAVAGPLLPSIPFLT